MSARRKTAPASFTPIPELRFEKTMDQVTHTGLDVVLTATDQGTNSLVRFGSAASCSSFYGRIAEAVDVRIAVAASADSPLQGPAIQRSFTFDSDGNRRNQSLILAAGDNHDKLGLLAFDEGSVCSVPAAEEVRHVISCCGWYGTDEAGWPSLIREWVSAGRIASFAIVSLDMLDEHLLFPLADLITRDRVMSIPSSLSPLSDNDLELLAIRGEQLVRMLVPHLCPDLG